MAEHNSMLSCCDGVCVDWKAVAPTTRWRHTETVRHPATTVARQLRRRLHWSLRRLRRQCSRLPRPPTNRRPCPDLDRFRGSRRRAVAVGADVTPTATRSIGVTWPDVIACTRRFHTCGRTSAHTPVRRTCTVYWFVFSVSVMRI